MEKKTKEILENLVKNKIVEVLFSNMLDWAKESYLQELQEALKELEQESEK